MRVEILLGKSGLPSDEEKVAITAAIEALFEREVSPRINTTPVWRFSGRWWR